MVLSMLMSFIMARIFRGKIYLISILAVLLLITFFSVGIPQYHLGDSDFLTQQPAILLESPVPLSFPLCASLANDWEHYTQYYQLSFHSSVFKETFVKASAHGERFFNFIMFDYVLYYSFFLLFNIMGAVIGYWLSKTAFMNNLLKKSEHLQSLVNNKSTMP